MRYKILALFGKSGSGKDTLVNTIFEQYSKYFHKIIPFTTRPKRENEIDGVDYYFVTEEEMEAMRLRHSFITLNNFNNWFYGVAYQSLDKNKINIGVFNDKALVEILPKTQQYNMNIEIIPLLIEADDKVRLLRCLNREEYPNCHEICRRFLADEQDYASLPFDYCLWNNNLDYRNNIEVILRNTEYNGISVSQWAREIKNE